MKEIYKKKCNMLIQEQIKQFFRTRLDGKHTALAYVGYRQGIGTNEGLCALLIERSQGWHCKGRIAARRKWRNSEVSQGTRGFPIEQARQQEGVHATMFDTCGALLT